MGLLPTFIIEENSVFQLDVSKDVIFFAFQVPRDMRDPYQVQNPCDKVIETNSVDPPSPS